MRLQDCIRDGIKSVYQENQAVYDTFAPILTDRKRLVEEHAKLDNLYRLVSGNVSGSRMDLETYARVIIWKRSWMRPTRRFQDMSAGQFELRMYDLEKAGEGKKQRSRSDGVFHCYRKRAGDPDAFRRESLVAALSLAPGMADEIQGKLCGHQSGYYVLWTRALALWMNIPEIRL